MLSFLLQLGLRILGYKKIVQSTCTVLVLEEKYFVLERNFQVLYLYLPH